MLLPPKLLESEEYGRMEGELRSLDHAEGMETVALLAEVMGPAERRWKAMQ